MAQEAGLVPIVEPEVLMDGDHDIDICEEVTEEVLRSVYNELSLQNVWLEGTLLKPNMAISGQDCSEQAGVQEVAERTLRCLKRTVRSEEHTSELQSLMRISYAVFCLKKKNESIKITQ